MQNNKAGSGTEGIEIDRYGWGESETNRKNMRLKKVY